MISFIMTGTAAIIVGSLADKAGYSYMAQLGFVVLVAVLHAIAGVSR